ncbi:hypothetical protein [Streptomyces wuyuanensis]|uniref:hypothetical protein n=1 Tax=Streptomyces wuyuanensis TaxID=1196353 RepID=UPI00343F91AC
MGLSLDSFDCLSAPFCQNAARLTLGDKLPITSKDPRNMFITPEARAALVAIADATKDMDQQGALDVTLLLEGAQAIFDSVEALADGNQSEITAEHIQTAREFIENGTAEEFDDMLSGTYAIYFDGQDDMITHFDALRLQVNHLATYLSELADSQPGAHIRALSTEEPRKDCFICCTERGVWTFGNKDGTGDVIAHDIDMQICRNCVQHLLETDPRCPTCRADLYTGEPGPALSQQASLTPEELAWIAGNQRQNPQR